jgi:hypothetical protein
MRTKKHGDNCKNSLANDGRDSTGDAVCTASGCGFEPHYSRARHSPGKRRYTDTNEPAIGQT